MSGSILTALVGHGALSAKGWFWVFYIYPVLLSSLVLPFKVLPRSFDAQDYNSDGLILVIICAINAVMFYPAAFVIFYNRFIKREQNMTKPISNIEKQALI